MLEGDCSLGLRKCAGQDAAEISPVTPPRLQWRRVSRLGQPLGDGTIKVLAGRGELELVPGG